jgi:methylenetetrahydrofolate dehydrogenase (NADP+)/methenyltetrahydrofolate cyclohydrolase
MKIDGNQIASTLYIDLKNRVEELKKKHITPRLSVILIGNDQASVSYVNQKQKWAKQIGAEVTVINYPTSISADKLENKIHQLNNDNLTHAILIQRPLPPQINTIKPELLIKPEKDIDAFHPNSPYIPPIALAVRKTFEKIYQLTNTAGVARSGGPPSSAWTDPPLGGAGSRRMGETSDRTPELSDNVLKNYLIHKKIIILGKGQAGGAPVFKHLQNLGLNPLQIDSQTQSPNELTRQADIIISSVGKPNIITKENIKKGVILIGIGIFRSHNGQLQGDYVESEIQNIASFYTPTPGGIGPVNVAMLLRNLVIAAEKISQP